MQPEPPFQEPDFIIPEDKSELRDILQRAREAEEEATRLMTPEQRARLEEKLEAVLAKEAAEHRVEVNGIWMTRREWKEYMEDCPHEHFSHPGVTLMDGSPMSICDRCKFIQHTPIAKMIEQGEV